MLLLRWLLNFYSVYTSLLCCVHQRISAFGNLFTLSGLHVIIVIMVCSVTTLHLADNFAFHFAAMLLQEAGASPRPPSIACTRHKAAS